MALRDACSLGPNILASTEDGLIESLSNKENQGLTVVETTKKTPKQSLLLNFEESSEEQESEENSEEFKLAVRLREEKKFLLFDLQDSDSQEGEEEESVRDKRSEDPSEESGGGVIFNERSCNEQAMNFEDEPNLSKPAYITQLLKNSKDDFFYVPIPKGYIFQCIIKRERTNDGESFFVYDVYSLQNFCILRPNAQGYSMISNCSQCRMKQVIGNITKSFFGTQFNCFSCESPKTAHMKGENKERLLTLIYSPNLFGLSGPRKMNIYIPALNKKQGITGKNNLEDVHKSHPQLVENYCNETPVWNEQFSAFVLNFKGRVTMSSVKNFVVGKQNKQGLIIFGKSGKHLFNLDIKYPFSVIQGLSLALSSLVKKLMCE